MMWHSWHSWHRTPLMIASRVLLSASRHYSLLARLQVLLTALSAFSLHPMSDPDLWSRSRLTLPCPAAAAEPPPAPLSPYPCHLCSKHKLKMMPHLHVHVMNCLCPAYVCHEHDFFTWVVRGRGTRRVHCTALYTRPRAAQVSRGDRDHISEEHTAVQCSGLPGSPRISFIAHQSSLASNSSSLL